MILLTVVLAGMLWSTSLLSHCMEIGSTSDRESIISFPHEGRTDDYQEVSNLIPPWPLVQIKCGSKRCCNSPRQCCLGNKYCCYELVPIVRSFIC